MTTTKKLLISLFLGIIPIFGNMHSYPTQHESHRCILIEGNIGSGKSTFLRLLNEHLTVQPVFEPVARWQDVGGQHNLLAEFYADIPRWVYSFQIYAGMTRLEVVEEAINALHGAATLLVERSIYTDRYCFAKNAFELGDMTPLEWSMYQEWFNRLTKTSAIKPDGIIYVRTNPQTCYNRIAQRNRSEEAGIPLEYLTLLHQQHEAWLCNIHETAPHMADVPVLIIDGSQDFEHNSGLLEDYIAKVCNFFNITRTTTSLNAQ